MTAKSNKAVLRKDASENATSLQKDDIYCFEGESLAFLLKSISSVIESERNANKVVPDKFWLKQRFGIGVNEVTRLLERMPPVDPLNADTNGTDSTCMSHLQHRRFAVSPKLQAVIVASDCNPKWLTKHLPSLAASRGVPVIHIKEKKEGSLRLGELVKLKTAIAIGVKVKGNKINEVFEQIICGKLQHTSGDIVSSIETI